MDLMREIEMIGSKYLAEAGLDYSHNKLGETVFTKTDGSEFYIQKIIQDYADAKKITKAKAQAKFDSMVAASLSKMKKSPKINGTMMDNIAESVAFELLEEMEMKDVKFEKRVFQELFQEVKSENPDFYPLSNAFEPKRVEPRIYYTPDPLTPEFSSIETAACTTDAKLIFNTPFMEKLMKFAQIKGIKADPTKLHGKKYESQGGNIPDAYLYCEFVLMHEIMHYANGDFFFEKAYNLNGNIVNYVGDFVSNYNLVKNGYAQLPIGLFNDEINYDRYSSYQQMYDVVEKELKKLSNKDQENMIDQLNKMGDEMAQDGEGADPEQGQNQGQPQDGQGQPQDGQGQPQDGQGSGSGSRDGEQSDSEKGEDGQGSGSGDGDSDKKDGQGSGDGQKTAEQKKKEEEEATARAKAREEAENNGETSGKAPIDPPNGKKKGKIPDSIDKAIKANQESQSEAQSDTSRKTKTGMNPNAAKPGDLADMMAGNNNGGNGLSDDGNPYELPERQYKPKLNWKQLLKKMVPSGTDKDETYTKPSRRTTSSMVSIAQTGSGVVKPGTKDTPSDKKGLCFVLDESGSTMDKIGEMKASILKLMEKNSKQLNGTMYMIKFSNDIHFFKIDLKKMKYGRIVNYNEFINTGKIDVKCTKNARDLFKSTYGGGTELNSKIANIVKKLKTKLNFNSIIFSDSDIAYGSNAETLKQIYKELGTKSFALIGTDITDYKAFADLLGDKQNITHF